MIVLIVTNRADDRQLVADRGQLGHVLGKVDSGNLGLNGGELTANLGGCVGLGIERLEVTRPAVEPDEDAARFTRGLLCGVGSQPKGVHEPAANECAQPQLEAVSSMQSFTVAMCCHDVVSREGRGLS